MSMHGGDEETESERLERYVWIEAVESRCFVAVCMARVRASDDGDEVADE